MGKRPISWFSYDESMKRRHFLTTTSAAIAASALSSCNKSSATTLRIYTWADYIDPKLVASFEKSAGCKIEIDTFDSNEAMLAKLTAGATGYDVLTPSSYMIKALVREKLLLPLDQSKIPNIKHIDPAYLKRALDPEMTHSVPYLMACTCIAWLGSKVEKPVASYEMFDRPALKGRITLLDDMREVLGAALLSLGFQLNSANPGELAKARDVARRWKQNIAKFESEQYKSGIASGEFHLVQGYPSDLLQVAEENGDIVVRIPQEGSAFSCDDLCITKDSKNAELAHKFINFITDPTNSAQNMQAVAGRSPNSSAYKLLSEDFRGNAALFPDEAVFAKCEPIDDLGDALALWSKTWDEVTAP
ncbi:MAG: spermidine/putrescine ABC transporter substrate-binding protein [Luteolibacter sp.]